MKKIYLLFALITFGMMADGQTTYTFNYTGAVQTWTVPSGVTSVVVTAEGAEGGQNSVETSSIAGGGFYTLPDRAGYGGCVTCTLTVTPGQVLNIYAGGQGAVGTGFAGGAGGYNGGATGGFGYYPYAGGGGGGASDIRIGGIALANRVIVAAGGGGAGGNCYSSTDADRGGDGGAGTGQAGFACLDAAGGGGTPTTGGTGGVYAGWGSGAAGTSGIGGAATSSGGGGGGGGYFGGGGGCWGGGGGGSNYTSALLCTSVSSTRGCNSGGNGWVTITVNNCSGTPTAGTATGTPSSGCGTYTSVLNLTGSTGGSGVTYQWQSSPDGITWTNVAGATTLPYTVTVTGTIYYQCIVTCTSSGSTATSTTIELLFYPNPVAISGILDVCPGTTTTLTDTSSSGGGTWTSSSGGIASVGSTTGVVTGVSSTGGTATITYTIAGGCYATAVVTVNTTPPPIGGTLSVCTGNTTTLTDGVGGGVWSSVSTGIATITTAGVVFGLSTGTSIISYSLGTGCASTAIVTVNQSPDAITGTGSVCTGFTLSLSDLTPGGTWTSSLGAIATVGPTSGVVTGAGGGIATISYTEPGGCYAVTPVTVNVTPVAIGGPTVVCLGSINILTDATGGGTWSSTIPSVASIVGGSGSMTAAGVGTTTISYVMPTGCYAIRTETVDSLPGPIAGSNTVCIAATTTMTDGGTGTWSTSMGTISNIGATTGVVTGIAAGTDTVTYTIGTGCFVTKVMTVNPLPVAIGANVPVCVNSTITLTDGTSPGTWSIASTMASVVATSGVVTGLAFGNPSVTYTSSVTGCFRTAILTVNPVPGTIAGILLICDGSTTSLVDALSGGTWTASNTRATVSSSTGVTLGVSPGLDTITYTMPVTGCKATSTVTVQPPPAIIGGVPHMCLGGITTLTDAVTGGVWVSGNPGVSSIDSFSGIATGVTVGTVLISYVEGVCNATVTVTVNSSPDPISGYPGVCTSGGIATLSDLSGGGTWTSTIPSIATISTSTGVLTGIALGVDSIYYTNSITGCRIGEQITVNPLPSPLAGPDSVCQGYSVALVDEIGGGTFSSAATIIATVGGTSGMVTGVSTGVTTITYTLAGTGCQITTSFKVNPILSASTMIGVMPGDTVCAGSMVTYSATSVNGGAGPVYTWKVNGVTVTGASGSTYSYSPSNGDVVRCVLTSDATCAIPNTALSNTVNMVVNPVTNPTVTMHQNLGDTVCTGSTLTFNVTSTSGGSSPQYLWTVNWMPVAAGVTSYVYTPVNGDIIRCGMVSSSACPVPDTAFAIDTMVVYGYDTPKVSLFNPGGIAVCEGQPITIIANTQWGGWGPNYYWSLNGTPMGSSGDSYTYMPHDSDSVTVMVVSNYQCTVPGDTVYSSVRIEVDPVIIVTITDSYGGLLSVGWSDTLVAHVQNGGLDPTYQWYRNGIMVPGANYYKFARSDFEEKDSISCVVTTGAGSACEGVKGHNWMILEVAPVGVGQIGTSIAQLRIEPNPNKGEFEIAGTSTGTATEATVVVTNVVGQEVYRGKAGIQSGRISGHISLDAGLPDGMYLLHIKSECAENVLRFALKK